MSQAIEREAVTFSAPTNRKARRYRYVACNKAKGTFATFGDRDFADEWQSENGGTVIEYRRLSDLPTWVVVKCMERAAATGSTLTDVVVQLGVATTIKTLRSVVAQSYAAYNRSASKINETPAGKKKPLPLLGIPKLPIGDELALDDIAAVFAGDDDDDAGDDANDTTDNG